MPNLGYLMNLPQCNVKYYGKPDMWQEIPNQFINMKNKQQETLRIIESLKNENRTKITV